MNITKNKVDLGIAFDKLKDALRRADKEVNTPCENIGGNYAKGYGILSTHVQTFIFLNTDAETVSEIRDSADDIPAELLTQKETSDDQHGPL